jgi:hypothetical protein
VPLEVPGGPTEEVFSDSGLTLSPDGTALVVAVITRSDSDLWIGERAP